MLRIIQVSKLTSKDGVSEQEKLACKLVLEIEPSLWCEYATYWLYTSFIAGTSYKDVQQYCLDILQKNVNLVIFDKHTLSAYLKFIQSVPQMTQEVREHFKHTIGQIKT